MKNIKYLQKLFFLFFMGVSLSFVCACGDDEDDEEYISHNVLYGHKYVDLGLSVKWATCNVGANSPEEYGGYYAWGETEEKSNYSWDTYKWSYHGSPDHMAKYCTKKNGFVTEDYRTVLVSVDDVARVNWGGSWRMPTLNEIIELINNCTWEWRNYNGVNGQLVTGPNGNSIFLPAAGFCSDGDILGSDNCFYWSATLSDYGDDSAYILYIIDHPQPWAPAYRNQGFPVRPVTE